jgi:hypothetical protein
MLDSHCTLHICCLFSEQSPNACIPGAWSAPGPPSARARPGARRAHSNTWVPTQNKFQTTAPQTYSSAVSLNTGSKEPVACTM